MSIENRRRERRAFKLLEMMVIGSGDTRDVIRDRKHRKPRDLAKDVVQMVDILSDELAKEAPHDNQ